MSFRPLLRLRNMNRLSLGVIEAIHGLNVGQHGEAPEADEGKEQGNDETDPDADGKDGTALPRGAELSLLQVEHLHLHLGEGEGDRVLGVVLVLGREDARLHAVKRRAHWSMDLIAVRGAHLLERELLENVASG